MEEIAERAERQPVVYGVFDNGPFPTIVKAVGVPPEPVGAAHLLVHEPDRWLPFRDTRQPAQRNPEQAQPVVDERPSCIGIGCGVRIRKRSSGGVIRSRLAASAKKANTSSRGRGSVMDVLKTWVDTLLIVVRGAAPTTGST
jgi:hypothetical protein